MNDLMHKWFFGDELACDFAAQLWTAIQEWDDLEDEGACSDTNGLIAWWAFGKEAHPFFAANAQHLRPVLHLMYLQWQASNVLDHGDKNDVAKSYMLRAAYYGVLHMMAWICGGELAARQYGPEIYRAYGETPADIWKEFNNA